MTQQAIPADVRERVIQAAAELYEQNGRQSLPTVDQVRRAARVDMNAASSIMKEWRRSQTVQAAPVAVNVPEVVSQANSTALAALWQQAQELANESLRAAQAAWDIERAELDAMRQELADAYETQAAELDQVKSAAEVAGQAADAAAQQAAQELASVRGELAQATTRAERAEATAAEAEKRVGDLRDELAKAHRAFDAGRQELADQQKANQATAAQLDQVRTELVKVQAKAEAAAESHQEQRKTAAQEAQRSAERLTTAQGERDQARKEAGTAREEAARLAGQLDTYKEQTAALLARVAPPEAKPASRKKATE